MRHREEIRNEQTTIVSLLRADTYTISSSNNIFRGQLLGDNRCTRTSFEVRWQERYSCHQLPSQSNCHLGYTQDPLPWHPSDSSTWYFRALDLGRRRNSNRWYQEMSHEWWKVPVYLSSLKKIWAMILVDQFELFAPCHDIRMYHLAFLVVLWMGVTLTGQRYQR